jgi:hypothetical protein
MKPSKPWNESAAVEWVQNTDAMRQLCRLVEGTLRLDVTQRPHEIRAAASMVIMLGRKNLWATTARESEEMADELDRLVGLASRQMGAVRQLFEKNFRANPELANDASYKRFLESIGQEIRILESRMSESSSKLPEEPPCTWGDFW